MLMVYVSYSSLLEQSTPNIVCRTMAENDQMDEQEAMVAKNYEKGIILGCSRNMLFNFYYAFLLQTYVTKLLGFALIF